MFVSRQCGVFGSDGAVCLSCSVCVSTGAMWLSTAWISRVAAVERHHASMWQPQRQDVVDGEAPISSNSFIQGLKLQTQVAADAVVSAGDKSIPSCNLVSQLCHCLKSSCHSCAGVSTGSCENTAARAQISWLNAGLTPCQSHYIFSDACLKQQACCNL